MSVRLRSQQERRTVTEENADTAWSNGNGPLLAALAIAAVHLILLAAAIPDYRVTIDSAYHVSLGRWYGEHYSAYWDYINFAPGGRPNLQGPLLHYAIGALGRCLGGAGSDYILANAILAVIQWIAAAATVGFFAWRLHSRAATMFAITIFTAAAFTASSFQVGIPSGWLFILLPWMIYGVFQGCPLLTAGAGTLAIYAHVAGFANVPVGLFLTGLVTRRWRDVLRAGAIIGFLTLPFSLHVVRYLAWFSGLHSRATVLVDPLCWMGLTAWVIWHRSDAFAEGFMAVWLAAPLAWLAEDPSRFLLHSGLAASAAAGMILAQGARSLWRTRQGLSALAIAGVITVCPLGVPSLAPEICWDAGLRNPRQLDWSRAQALASVIAKRREPRYLISEYLPPLCPAIAVFAPVACEKGHWVEVQPRPDPADRLPLEDWLYIVPAGPNDPLVKQLVELRWLAVLGGIGDTSVLRLAARPPAAVAALLDTRIIHAEARWIVANAVNNTISWRGLGRVRALLRRQDWVRRRRQLTMQRAHLAHLELAILVYAYALEPSRPGQARTLSRCARRMGEVAGLLGDGAGIDLVSAASLDAFKQALMRLEPDNSPQRLASDLVRLLNRFFRAKGSTYA
jgi:hypothetical protein